MANKDNKKPAAPVQEKPAPKKVAPAASAQKKTPKKPVEHEAKGKTPNGDPAEEINVKPTTEENASLLGRLRRAIGENKDPYSTQFGTNLPLSKKNPLYKKPLYKPPVNKVRNAPPPVLGGEIYPAKPVDHERMNNIGDKIGLIRNIRKEEVELDEVNSETLERYRKSRLDQIDAIQKGEAPDFKTSREFRNAMLGGARANAKLGKGKMHVKVLATKEEVEQTNEAVLNLAQRIKRAQIMRREAPRIERAREISRTRFARDSQLKNRAEALARRLVKKRFAGEREWRGD